MKRLLEFWRDHPTAEKPLKNWYKLLSSFNPNHFAELKDIFGSVDVAENYTIFDVGGNKYRIITIIYYESKLVLIRHVFTHNEYDNWDAEEEQKQDARAKKSRDKNRKAQSWSQPKPSFISGNHLPQ